jgi:hypothetical protein
MADNPRVQPPRPRLSNAEVLAMSRMLRLYLKDDKFFNPLVAMDTARLAKQAMTKLEAWRNGGVSHV